jgi:hypothetical protein
MPCLASNQVRNLGPLALLAWLSGCVVPLGTTGQPPPNQDVVGPDGGLTMVPTAPDAGPEGGGAIFADAGPWINVSSNLAGLASECGNLTLLSSRPDRDMLIAGVALQGLWANVDGGTVWSNLGAGADAGPGVITNRPSKIVYDPVHLDTFWESGIYNSSGIYRTDDNGQTFLPLGSATHDDSVGVDFTDPMRQTLLAGGHEQTNRLLRSTNGGNDWMDIGPQLPTTAGYLSEVLVLNAQVHLVGTSNGTASGVYRTTDGGGTWTQVYSQPGGGGVVGHPLVASDGSLYWLLETNAGIIHGTSDGTSWTLVTGTGIVSDYFGGATIIELPDNRLMTLGNQTLIISSNQGVSWETFGTPLPMFYPEGVLYSPFRKTLYIWHDDCSFGANDPVLANAVMALPFDYQSH